MKLMTWNIRFGGLFGKEDHSDRILDYLCVQNETDLFVLTDYQAHSAGLKIAAGLAAAGWEHQITSEPPDQTTGVLVASRQPVTPLGAAHPLAQAAPGLRASVAGARLLQVPLTLLGVRLEHETTEDTRQVWHALLDYVRQFRGLLVLAGDFGGALPGDSESGSGTAVNELTELNRLLHDAWALCNTGSHPHKDRFTWYDPKTQQGSRLDYIWLSPGLSATFARHMHGVREQAISHHSALIARFAIQEPERWEGTA